MAIKTLDDIEREKHNENRTRLKKEITEDVNEVLSSVFKKPKIQEKKTLSDRIFQILKIIGILILILIIVNLLLGNIWLLKFFIKSLFFNN